MTESPACSCGDTLPRASTSSTATPPGPPAGGRASEGPAKGARANSASPGNTRPPGTETFVMVAAAPWTGSTIRGVGDAGDGRPVLARRGKTGNRRAPGRAGAAVRRAFASRGTPGPITPDP